MEAARFLQRQGWDVTFVGGDRQGTIDLDEYAAAFRDDTRLASVMLANNVVGTLQPVAELARIAHERGAVFHTDAVQVAGSLPLVVDELGVDLLSLSAHKFSTAPKAAAPCTSVVARAWRRSSTAVVTSGDCAPVRRTCPASWDSAPP